VCVCVCNICCYDVMTVADDGPIPQHTSTTGSERTPIRLLVDLMACTTRVLDINLNYVFSTVNEIV